MSEIKHKEWQTIKNLRDEIRQDMEDYKLLWTDVNAGRDEYQVWYLFLPQGTNNQVHENSLYYKFSKYLGQKIINNLSKLEQLVSKEEENK